MFYREAGQFKTSYGNDQAVFPIIQDRWFIALVLIVAYAVVPFVADEYWLQAVIIPFLIFSLAAIGLNLLTGYAGQLSLGTGGASNLGQRSGLSQSVQDALIRRALDLGVYVIGFSFPVVPRGQARIRTQMNAALTREELTRALAAFGKVGKSLGVIS